MDLYSIEKAARDRVRDIERDAEWHRLLASGDDESPRRLAGGDHRRPARLWSWLRASLPLNRQRRGVRTGVGGHADGTMEMRHHG